MSSLATSTPSHGADSRPTLSRAISDATSSLSHLSISPGSGTGVPISRNPPRSPGQEKSSSGSAADSPILGPGFPELQASSSRTTIRGEGGSLEGNRGEASSWYPGGATLSRPLSAPVAPTSLLAPVLSSNSTHDDSPLSRTLSAPSTDLLSRSQTTLVSTPRQIRPFSHPNASRPRASTSATGSYPAARYVPNRHPPPQSPIRTSGFKIAASPPSSLQSHLYTSGLLESTLSDLHLVAFSHFYRLHRIVLGQSGYFSSLLAGGFSEERSGPARKDESEVIYVGMDRPLTRSAFEFCLARLYGGGPELVPPPWARTSQEHPLSEMFERLWMRSLEMKGVRGTGTEDWEQVAAIGVQPATPTFLLSLLAQSTYLEIPSLQAKALQMIHNTLTPWTVGQYLGFSLGNGLGPSSSHLDLSTGLYGLEGVGTPYDLPRSRANTSSSTSSSPSYTSVSQFDGPFFVGPEGERVGEACACWLAKWGREILAIEEWLEEGGEEEELPASLRAFPDLAPPPLRVWSSKPGGLPARWVRGVISSDAFFLGALGEREKGEFARYFFARRVVELRRRGKSVGKAREREKERERVASVHGTSRSTETSVYEVAGEPAESDFEAAMGKAAAEMEETGESDEEEEGKETRRVLEEELVEDSEAVGKEVDTDEEEYAELFRTGIRYSQLTFKQLRFIAQDVSPTTGVPYAPKASIEHAFWQAEDFKSRIPVGSASYETQTSHATYAAGPTNTTFADVSLDGETLSNSSEEPTQLGLATVIEPGLELKTGQEPGRYFLVPVDDTTRINDGPMPGAPESSPKAKPSTLATGAEAFFGLALETRLGADGPSPGVIGTREEATAGRRFVPYEPFRFSAEFWGVGELREKQRLYSETFFYAGSSYNIYLQKIQEKGVQLGVYLHRQNSLEPFPSASSPPLVRPAGRSVLGDMFGAPVHSSLPVKPPPYIDQRKSIQSFFSIWCPNQLGSTLTKFSSGPDTFALSQSWGWKSTSLAAALGLPTDTSGDGLAGRFNSLRVTLVMGIV